MATVTVYSDSSDGHIESNDPSYPVARSGGGSLAVFDTGKVSYAGQQPGYTIYEAFYNFDFSGSGVSPGASISNAVLEFVLGSSSAGDVFILQARLYDWGSSLAVGDYVPGSGLALLPLLAFISSSGINTDAQTTDRYQLTPNGEALNSAVSAANATDGILRVMLCSQDTALNVVAAHSNYIFARDIEYDGTTNGPKLTFDWSVGQPAVKRMGGVKFNTGPFGLTQGIRGW